MSQFTNYAENKVADFMRGQTLTLPSSWFIALGSAASDSSFTELAGTGYARQPVVRSLANWAGTQGAGTTLASSGTSHTTSNNVQISWGTPASSWGTATHIGFFDALTSGNCWIWVELASSIDASGSSEVKVLIANLTFSLGLNTCSDYLANSMIDLVFRAQAFSWPSTIYLALYTTVPSKADSGGTEVSGGSYARASIASSLAALSGTQGVGTTSASSGTSGRITNNDDVSFASPTADWGDVEGEGIRDAATLGNLLFINTFSSPISVLSGGAAPTHASGSLGITLA